MAENTTGELTLTSNTYATSMPYTKTEVNTLITDFQTDREVTTSINTALTDYTNTTDLTTLLSGKHKSLNFPAGTGGTPFIDESWNNVRKNNTNSPLSFIVESGVTIKLSCDCY